MISYIHLTIRKQEMLFFYHGFGFNIRGIGRNLATVMRELRRNTAKDTIHSPSLTQKIIS